MKKITVIGVVVLLLLAIAVVDFYIKNDGSGKNKNQESGALNTNGVGNLQPGNAATTAVVNNPEATAPGNAPRRKMNHRQKYLVANDYYTHAEWPAEITPAGSHMSRLPEINDNKEIEVGTEIPSDYYAYFNNDLLLGNKRKPGHVNFAPEVGVNMNGFYNTQYSNMAMTNAFHIGGIINICLGNHFALQPGIMYIKTGNENMTSSSSGNMDVNTTDKEVLNNIELPVDLVCKFGDWRSARFIVGLGPYISYLASSKNITETSTSVDNTGYPASRGSANATDGGAGSYETPNPPSSVQPGALRNLDWGAGCFIGAETPKGFFAKAGAQVGFRNLQQNIADGNYYNRNYNFLLSIGQFIGK